MHAIRAHQKLHINLIIYNLGYKEKKRANQLVDVSLKFISATLNFKQNDKRETYIFSADIIYSLCHSKTHDILYKWNNSTILHLYCKGKHKTTFWRFPNIHRAACKIRTTISNTHIIFLIQVHAIYSTPRPLY